MAKIYIYCIRHAQGHHNLSFANHSMHDPLLTSLGETQCESLSKTFPHTHKLTHLVSSPLKRTLYTTLLSFPSLVHPNGNFKVIALPEIQETSSLPCDTGSAPHILEKEFSEGQVDLGLLGEEWNSNTGPFATDAKSIEARATKARQFLRQLGEQHLVQGQEEVHMAVVTHGGFLHYFTEDFEGAINDGTVGTGWSNTEWRSYTFIEGDDKAGILETKESRKKRRGEETYLSREEQMRLKMAAEREWGASGFQDEGEGKEEAKL